MGKAGAYSSHARRQLNYETVAQWLCELCDQMDVKVIAYDRWRIDILKSELAKLGRSLRLRNLVRVSRIWHRRSIVWSRNCSTRSCATAAIRFWICARSMRLAAGLDYVFPTGGKLATTGETQINRLGAAASAFGDNELTSAELIERARDVDAKLLAAIKSVTYRHQLEGDSRRRGGRGRAVRCLHRCDDQFDPQRHFGDAGSVCC